MSTKRIWSANGTAEYLKSLSEEAKRANLPDYGYDPEQLEGLTNEQLDELIAQDDNMWQIDADELEHEIIPKLNAQTRDGVLFFYGSDRDIDISYADYAEHLAGGGSYGMFYIEIEDVDGLLQVTREDGMKFILYTFPESDEELAHVFEETLPLYIDNLCEDEPELRDKCIQKMCIEGNLPDMYQDKDLGDFSKIPGVLKPAVLNMNEELEKPLNEASVKNEEGLQAELDEIKPIADEYGFEYFTAMPLINFDNDTTSIEYNYPNFFRIIKAFFKEMDILEDPDDMDELEDNWYTFSQIDWDTCMKVADKCLATGKSQQVEKVYKDMAKDDLPMEESLEKEDKSEEPSEEPEDKRLNESAAWTLLDEIIRFDQLDAETILDELEVWLPHDKLIAYTDAIIKDLDVEPETTLRDVMSVEELLDRYVEKLSSEEENEFAKDLMKNFDLDEESIYDDYTDGADDFSESKESLEGNSLNESVEDMSEEEWDNIGKVMEEHRGELERAEEEAWQYALRDSNARWSEDYHLDEYKDEIEDLFKIYIADTIRDILFEAKLDANIKDISDKDLIKELDIDISTEMPDWLEEEAYNDYKAEKENAGFDESLNESVKENLTPLTEANETYLNNKWNERAQKVCDSYKEFIGLDEIPMNEDLADWAVSSVCSKYNECRDNVIEMLNNARNIKKEEELVNA